MTMSASSTRTAAEVRREFIEFFSETCDHTFAPSSPVVPHDDPTLLFTNAGMNQFKDVFLGQGSRTYTRAVNSQKCIRAGGKHNDLEDVGKDTYHHTFFEMLGNWSFGDYFKDQAIQWAWELLVERWGLDPERLYVTVFEGDAEDGLEADEEAENIWRKFVPADRISRWGRKDNFWEMGESGPCGPCSEIHFDSRSDAERAKLDGGELVNRDHPDVIEIWNLVFIQFNRGDDRKLTPLPEKHVDTGMGLERIVRVMQGKRSNYDTDLWTPLFDAIQRRTGARVYEGAMEDPTDIAYRVIADHIRCLTTAISDGATPSNEGRGYVLRRILRRAVRMLNQTLGVKEPALCDLVPAVVDSLGNAFPELDKHADRVAGVIREEELAFLRTLERGLELFAAAADATDDNVVSGEDAFKLHDTFGFPIDLTQVMAEERGMSVDLAGYESRMQEAREASRGGGSTEDGLTLPPDALARLKYLGVEPTKDDDKHHGRPTTTTLRAIWNGKDFDNRAEGGQVYKHRDAGPDERQQRIALITERTNFYAEQGGQVGDIGVIRDVDDDRSEFRVIDTQVIGGYVMHLGHLVSGRLTVDEKVNLTIDRTRRAMIRAHHTTTHILNHALRQVMGDEIDQKGSLVADDRLRFDFSCPRALTDSEINAVERLTNAAIHQKLPVHVGYAPLNRASEINGLRAVFGERYPDPVRVVSVGVPIEDLLDDPLNPRWPEYSIEFCGGTHLEDSGEAKKFVITQETNVAAGVRRIMGVTGPAALAASTAGQELESRSFRAVNLPDEEMVEEYGEIVKSMEELSIGVVSKHRITEHLEKLRSKVRRVQKQAHSAARDTVVEQARVLAESIQGRMIVDTILGADKETLRAAMDVIKARRPDVAALLLSADDEAGKVSIMAIVPDELIKEGLKAGDWVREAAKACDGGGGGRPDKAEAGGKDPDKIDDARNAAVDFAERALR